MTSLVEKNSILVRLSKSKRTQFGKVAFVEQTEPQKVFSAIWELEGQVNNGGFWQFFWNSGGEMAHYAPRALRQIGAVRCAAIVEQALNTVGGVSLPEPEAARREFLDSLPASVRQHLEPLDQEFMSYPDNLTDLLYHFVASHPSTFGPVG